MATPGGKGCRVAKADHADCQFEDLESNPFSESPRGGGILCGRRAGSPHRTTRRERHRPTRGPRHDVGDLGAPRAPSERAGDRPTGRVPRREIDRVQPRVRVIHHPRDEEKDARDARDAPAVRAPSRRLRRRFPRPDLVDGLGGDEFERVAAIRREFAVKTIDELAPMCREKGLSATGDKSELIDRLMRAKVGNETYILYNGGRTGAPGEGDDGAGTPRAPPPPLPPPPPPPPRPRRIQPHPRRPNRGRPPRPRSPRRRRAPPPNSPRPRRSSRRSRRRMRTSSTPRRSRRRRRDELRNPRGRGDPRALRERRPRRKRRRRSQPCTPRPRRKKPSWRRRNARRRCGAKRKRGPRRTPRLKLRRTPRRKLRRTPRPRPSQGPGPG